MKKKISKCKDEKSPILDLSKSEVHIVMALFMYIHYATCVLAISNYSTPPEYTSSQSPYYSETDYFSIKIKLNSRPPLILVLSVLLFVGYP